MEPADGGVKPDWGSSNQHLTDFCPPDGAPPSVRGARRRRRGAHPAGAGLSPDSPRADGPPAAGADDTRSSSSGRDRAALGWVRPKGGPTGRRDPCPLSAGALKASPGGADMIRAPSGQGVTEGAWRPSIRGCRMEGSRHRPAHVRKWFRPPAASRLVRASGEATQDLGCGPAARSSTPFAVRSARIPNAVFRALRNASRSSIRNTPLIRRAPSARSSSTIGVVV